MNINYEAYRVFYYTAKTRSFTQAANALGNSQPNITRIIKNLERELGCTLFLRNNRHVELTAEGETLYRHVSAAFEQLQAGEEALLRGLADLAFVTSPIDMTDKLRSTPLTDVQEIAVCGSAYRSLTGSPVTLEALAEYPMISLGADGSAYRLYRQFFAENHVPFEPDIEAATADQILPMVKANLGIGFVPASFPSEEDWGHSIFRIDLTENIPLRKVCMVESTQHPAAAAVRELKSICLAQTKS